MDAGIEHYHKVRQAGGCCAALRDACCKYDTSKPHAAESHLAPENSTPFTQALGLRPEDAFTAEMLAEAMQESSAAFEAQLRAGAGAGAPV